MLENKVKWGESTKRILDLLQESSEGATAVTLAAELGIHLNIVRRTMGFLTKALAEKPQRAHISGWTKHEDGCRDYPRPIYKFGPGENKPRPKRKPRRQIVQDWYRKRKLRLTGMHAFNPAAVFIASKSFSYRRK